MFTFRLAMVPLIGAALATAPFSVRAQTVSQIKLKPATATLNEEFTVIGHVRELADGRVLVTDPRDRKLVVGDFQAGSATPVGRSGTGPGEYQQPFDLFALAADSTLMPDGAGRRWLLLVGTRIVQTLPPETPAIQRASVVYGVDLGGWVVGLALARPAPNKPALDGDSLYVVRVNRATATADTVGRLRRRSLGRGAGLSTAVLDNDEQALLFADGWIAFARLDPYRIDWRAPDGRMIRGAPLPVSVVRVTEREKRAHMQRMVRGTGRPPLDVSAVPDWADVIAPVSGILELPDMTLLIQRARTADAEFGRYDIVDRRGVLVRQVSLMEKERIVGFGPKWAYVAWKDDDDIERLRRHPWP